MCVSKKIIVTICAFAIAISLVMPVAANAVEVTSGANYWQSISADSALLRAVIGAFHSGVCPAANSPDGKHHANTDIPRPNTDNHSFGGYKVKCEYCGEDFMISTSDLAAAYDAYVEEMPGNGYDSNGLIYWTVPLSAHNGNAYYYRFNDRNYGKKCEHYVSNDIHNWDHATAEWTPDTVLITFTSGKNRPNGNYINERWNFVPPVKGRYDLVAGTMGSVSDSDENGNVHNGFYFFFPEQTFSVTDATEQVELEIKSANSHVTEYNIIQLNIVFNRPTFRIVPFVNIDTGTVYNINTRAGTVSGDLAVMGDNNTLTKVNTTIINETNNTYYNPTTDTTSTISDWSYNYTDRSYTLTLENGDEAQVVYGNDNVTITEGGNTYTYYYYVDETTNNNNGSGSGGSGGGNFFGNATGTDLWGAVGDTLGSLLLAPLRIIETVLVKVIGWLGSLAETIGDGIANLVETILGWFDSLPELFSGFLGFLTAIFPFIPEEAMVFITVGLAAVVIIGIIRALRRR